jgi:hypothetical protein
MLCRRLERELNAANAIIRQQQLLEQENDAANAEIERLTAKVALLYEGAEEQKQRILKLNDYVAAIETAGDLMANELSYGYDVDMWHKAKEAKP